MLQDNISRLAFGLFLVVLTGFAVSLAGPLLAPAIAVAGSLSVLIFVRQKPVQEEIRSAPPPIPLADEQIRMLLAGVGDPLLLQDKGVITAANPAACKLLGDHVIGQDIRLAIRHPDAGPVLAGEKAGPVVITGLGGREAIWKLRSTPFGEGGQIIHLMDRSHRAAAERARVDFVANASHELRTPLATLLGFIETLEDDKAGSDPATRARFLGVMQGEAKRMQSLVDDLISLSRIEADKHRAPNDPVQMADVVTEVLAAQIGPDGRPRTDLVTEVEEGLPPIAGDARQLVQLVRNLVENALKYGGSDQPVEVKLAREGAMLSLVVADHGPGVPPEHLPRLTERFYRVDAGRSRERGGTGLGLSIVKHIVERHRGQFLIDSKMGEGTRVTVLFPPLRK